MADAATTADAVRTDTGARAQPEGLDLVTLWHFTYGLKGFCWTWGIAVGRLAQRRVTQVAWLLFLLLSVGTLSILFQLRFGAVG